MSRSHSTQTITSGAESGGVEGGYSKPVPIADTVDRIHHLFAAMTDKAGMPYVDHCLRVALALPPDATDDERHAALLHDVLEDTTVTADDLRKWGYSERTIALVEALTKPAGMAYEDYIASIRGSGAERIKIADLRDNSDPRRLARLPKHTRNRLSWKYSHALRALGA